MNNHTSMVMITLISVTACPVGNKYDDRVKN